MVSLLLAATLLFPTIKGDNLAGKAYTLPRDLEGRVNILLMAFQRGQQPLVDTWLPDVKKLHAAQPDLRYYELPTISRGYVLLRPMIDGGMRSGIKDPVARATTITIYTDTSNLRSQLGFPTDETIYVLLLDRQGYVRWQADGPMTPSKLENLTAAVSELLATP